MQFEQILEGFVFLEAPRVDDDGNLYFSEVMEGGVHRLSPDGKLDSFITDRKYIGGLALTEDGGFVCSGRAGLEYFNPATGKRRALEFLYDGRPIVHINDIQPDDQGGLYVGGTHDPDIQEGGLPRRTNLYRLDPSGAAIKLWDGMEISNGLGLSPDRSRLYFSETFKGLVVFEVTSERTLRNRRLLAEFSGADGLQVDAEGGIWVANYALGHVTRFMPDGRVDRFIDFSDRFEGCRITSLTFGGADLQDLYVVTAGDYRKPPAKDGRIYRARSDVPGQPTPKVRF
ncbi:MAG: SMP-30/Gluconolaconase/LRE protein [Rhodospirillales bacterium]|nr:SMP-30/Gluconolaconase/LRE protein [Rhodospirillales bacterium]